MLRPEEAGKAILGIKEPMGSGGASKLRRAKPGEEQLIRLFQPDFKGGESQIVRL